MKTLIITFITVFSASSFASDGVVLNSKKIRYGALEQSARTAVLDTVEIIRTKKTPRKVDFYYSVKKSEKVCTDYENRRVWVPARYETVCNVVVDGQGRATTVCQRVQRGGYYTNQRHCVAWDNVMVTRDKKIRLDFRKAARLSGDEREVFEIEFRQKRVTSSEISLSGDVIESRRRYSIEHETFMKDSLKFKAR